MAVTTHTVTLHARRPIQPDERVPKPLRPGQVHCPVCRKGAALVRNTGLIRAHKDLFGWPCYNVDPPLVVLASYGPDEEF